MGVVSGPVLIYFELLTGVPVLNTADELFRLVRCRKRVREFVLAYMYHDCCPVEMNGSDRRYPDMAVAQSYKMFHAVLECCLDDLA